jgi:N-acetylmuramoyl-L-alanine amidase
MKSARNRDRGIRKAPFVVLIGASMPSVLAEIGFVSNAQDERLLKRPETRQKIAEALYKGLSQYAATLSHFQVAETRTSKASTH